GGEQTRVIRHCLRAARVPGEWRRRDFQLLGQPLNKRLDRLLQLSECHAGVAKQSELNGKANAIGIAAADRHQVLIGPGQGEAKRHAVLIDWDADECVALIVGLFFFNDTATTEIYTLSLHDALPNVGYARVSTI